MDLLDFEAKDLLDTLKKLKSEEQNFIEFTLKYIHYELGNIFQDIARIHLISAEQAFFSAKISNNFEGEIRVGIGHLRDAFNSFQISLDKGRSIKIFGLSVIRFKWWSDNRTKLLLKLASVASVISILYLRIEDENNYMTWKSNAINISEQYKTHRSKHISDWQKKEDPDSEPLRGLAALDEGLLDMSFRQETKFINELIKAVKNI